MREQFRPRLSFGQTLIDGLKGDADGKDEQTGTSRPTGKSKCLDQSTFETEKGLSSCKAFAALGDTNKRTVQPGELQSCEVLCERGDEVLQHCDGHLFTEPETNLGITSVVNAPKVATHGDVERQLVHFSSHRQSGIGERNERETIGTRLHDVRDQLRLVEECLQHRRTGAGYRGVTGG